MVSTLLIWIGGYTVIDITINPSGENTKINPKTLKVKTINELLRVRRIMLKEKKDNLNLKALEIGSLAFINYLDTHGEL